MGDALQPVSIFVRVAEAKELHCFSEATRNINPRPTKSYRYLYMSTAVSGVPHNVRLARLGKRWNAALCPLVAKLGHSRGSFVEQVTGERIETLMGFHEFFRGVARCSTTT
jgi:hypothetical protein